MRRVEKDREAGWIARRKDGSIIPDDDFRWNTRAGARCVVIEHDLFGDLRDLRSTPATAAASVA